MNDLSLSILDLVENSIAARATSIDVTVNEDHKLNRLIVTIIDNGCGMDEVTVKNALDPFYTTKTTRRVGLGLPFVKMAAEDAGGTLFLSSKPSQGTELIVSFTLDHVNTPPLGDLASTIYTICAHQAVQGFTYHHLVGDHRFDFDLQQVKTILQGVPVTDGSVMKFLLEYLNENIDLIRGGTL
jgi:hypothetical protein